MELSSLYVAQRSGNPRQESCRAAVECKKNSYVLSEWDETLTQTCLLIVFSNAKTLHVCMYICINKYVILYYVILYYIIKIATTRDVIESAVPEKTMKQLPECVLVPASVCSNI